MNVLYEDNHIIVINKAAGEIVQGDKTGDKSLCDTMKAFLKEKYAKPGNVFVGLPHRLDRPVSGAVLFAKTSKALVRLNEMIRKGEIRKHYWAIVEARPASEQGSLRHYILRDGKTNRSHAYNAPHKEAKEARLNYEMIGCSDRYTLLDIELLTGRHHQIRCQLSKIGCPIKGDLKYGAKRSNPNGGISLHSRSLSFMHPVRKELVEIIAPVPTDDNLWKFFAENNNTL
jgi:23S rRNA pseudouridine1911/1915/1917 synthase